MEDPRYRTAGCDPCMILPGDCDAAAACCERCLVRKSTRHIRSWNFLPGRAAIVCANHQETAVNRVAESDTVIRIPKRKRVEECCRLMIGKLQDPGCSSIGGLVDTRLFPFTDAQHIRGIGINTVHVAKIQIRCSWND